MMMLFSLLVSTCSPPLDVSSLGLPGQVHQIVIVESPSWSSQTGTLRTFAKTGNRWELAQENVAVTLGVSGLAWGRGLHADGGEGPRKQEGDGKAPAGMFRLGPGFGYAGGPPSGSRLPYRQAGDRDYYVSDPDSKQYNQWVTLPRGTENDPTRFWKSFERMKRDDALYTWGLVVEHNVDPVVAGGGSAIFMHVWRRPGAPTAGCTAMARADLVALLRWLDPAKNPVLVQAPCGELSLLRIRPSRVTRQ